MSVSIPRRGLAALAAAGALLLVASITAPRADAATFYACVKKNGNAHIFTKKPKCKKGETKLSWSNQGGPGKNGLNGLNGVNGKNGTNGINGTNGTNAPVPPSLVWHNLALETGWTAYPGPYASTPRLRKGLMGFRSPEWDAQRERGTKPHHKLPEGFRPTTEHAWVTPSETNSAFDPHLTALDIQQDGNVFIYNDKEANDDFVSLEGVAFFAG